MTNPYKNLRFIKVLSIMKFGIILLFIFIMLKLFGFISWSWIWVLSPYWLTHCFLFILNIAMGILIRSTR